MKKYAIIVLILLACQVQAQPPPKAFSEFTPLTAVSLKEYLDVRMTKFHEYVDQRFDLLIQARNEVRDAKILAQENVWQAKFLALENLMLAVQAEWASKHAALEKAIEVARVSMEARLTGMNEFRASLKDQAAQFITRSEFNQLRDEQKHFIHLPEFAQVVEKQNGVLQTLKELVPRKEMELSQHQQDQDIASLRETRAKLEGMATQNSVNVALLISLFSLGAGVLGTLLAYKALNFHKK